MTLKVNVPDAKVTYPVNELVNYLLDETGFGHVFKYRTLPKLKEEIKWSLNPKILLDFGGRGSTDGSSSVESNGKVCITGMKQASAMYKKKTIGDSHPVITDNMVEASSVHTVNKPVPKSIDRYYWPQSTDKN